MPKGRRSKPRPENLRRVGGTSVWARFQGPMRLLGSHLRRRLYGAGDHCWDPRDLREWWGDGRGRDHPGPVGSEEDLGSAATANGIREATGDGGSQGRGGGHGDPVALSGHSSRLYRATSGRGPLGSSAPEPLSTHESSASADSDGPGDRSDPDDAPQSSDREDAYPVTSCRRPWTGRLRCQAIL